MFIKQFLVLSQHSTIGDIKQGNKRAMSNTSADYKWGKVYSNIQVIESQIDLKNRTTYFYDPKFCSADNDGCSQRSYHNIGGFVPMKKIVLMDVHWDLNID